MESVFCNWRSSLGVKSALVYRRGRKWIQMIVIGSDGLFRFKKIPRSDEQYLTPMVRSQIKKKTIRAIARKKGTSTSVRRAIRELLVTKGDNHESPV